MKLCAYGAVFRQNYAKNIKSIEFKTHCELHSRYFLIISDLYVNDFAFCRCTRL